jgi:hypothetical protein
MSHYGIYLGGYIRTPGVERTAPPERPQDRPAYGRVQLMALEALATPCTVAELATRLGWDWDRAHSWIHALKRQGRIRRVGTVQTTPTRTANSRRQQAGRYQAVTS